MYSYSHRRNDETIRRRAPAGEPGPTASPRNKKAGIEIGHSRQLPAHAQAKLHHVYSGVGFMSVGGSFLVAIGTLGLGRYRRLFHQVVSKIPALVLDGLASVLRLVLGAPTPN